MCHYIVVNALPIIEGSYKCEMDLGCQSCAKQLCGNKVKAFCEHKKKFNALKCVII